MAFSLRFVPGFREILADVKTGCVALFRGGAPSALMTELYTDSNDSHIGLIVRYSGTYKLARPLPAGEILLWECVRGAHNTCFDYMTGTQRRDGPRLVLLTERVSMNYDELDIRLMTMRLAKESTDERLRIEQALMEFFHSHRNWSFDDKRAHLALSAYDGPLGENARPRPDEHTFFCSEGVARALQAAGMMSLQENPRELTPCDFARRQLLQHGAYFELPTVCIARSIIDEGATPCEVLCGPTMIWRVLESMWKCCSMH